MKKLNTSGFAGVAAAAILAVVGLAPSANAQVNFVYETNINPALVGTAYTGGFFSLKYNNFDMGTTYGATANGSYGSPTPATGITTLNGLAGQVGPTGSGAFAEDSWGIAKVSTIEDALGNVIWSQVGKQQEITVMFYGSQDFFLTKDGVQQVTSSVGLHSICMLRALSPRDIHPIILLWAALVVLA